MFKVFKLVCTVLVFALAVHIGVDFDKGMIGVIILSFLASALGVADIFVNGVKPNDSNKL